MIMSVIFQIIQLIPCAVNLLFSVWIACCFRRYPKPPLWSIFCLLVLGIGTIRLLFLGWNFTLQHPGIHRADRDLVCRAGARPKLPKVVGI